MTLFDVIALIVLVISGLVGFSRGAVRELVTVLAFGIAALASVVMLPLAAPLTQQSIHPAWAANALAVVVVFVIVYILFRMAGGWVTARLHSQAALGTLDRMVGLGFGVLRALIFLGVFYLVFNAATGKLPELTPRWIANARLLPVAKASAEAIEVFAPRGLKAARRLGPALERAGEPAANEVNEPVAEAPRQRRPTARDTSGYGKAARDDIDALVERTR